MILSIVVGLQLNLVGGDNKVTIGEKLYIRNCWSCHSDPRVGMMGPELITTPDRVFKPKILTKSYPDGYKPKRSTKLMPTFKLTDEEIEAIVKYVRSK